MSHGYRSRQEPPQNYYINFFCTEAMPREKNCQHPTNHAMSASKPKGSRPVSLKLSLFLTSRYNIYDTRLRWLSPRCYRSELADMNSQVMEIDIYENVDENEFFTEKVAPDMESDDFEDNDYDCDANDGHLNEEINDDQQDSDERSSSESIEEEPTDLSLDLEYRRNEAFEKLSSVFRMFNIDAIHDR